ncbi:MAG: hypothetical protein JST93_21655 [Acidobacteria bacterium]|nr:hypothetical protein [Acidobacteriota bacterium]
MKPIQSIRKTTRKTKRALSTGGVKNRTKLPKELLDVAVAWIRPCDVWSAANRYMDNRSKALALSQLVLSSDDLAYLGYGNFEQLCDSFLQSFHIPSDFLHLLEILRGQRFRDEARQWLQTLKFEGSVGHANMSLGLREQPHLRIVERDAVVDILRPIIGMLQSESIRLAKVWGMLPQLPSKDVYLRHSCSRRFEVSLEAAIAAICGYPGSNLMARRDVRKVEIRYRAVTVGGDFPGDPKVLEVARKTAFRQAEETFEPDNQEPLLKGW